MPIRNSALFVLLLIAVSTARAASVPLEFDRTAWQSDYAVLKRTLEREYANLAWAGSIQSGIDLPAWDRQTSRALATVENNDQAERALRTFVAGFKDGHFSFLGIAAVGVAVDEPPYPDVAQMDAPAGCAALGFAPGSRVGFTLPFESLRGFRMLGDGEQGAFRFGVLTSDGGDRIGIVRIREFEAQSYPALCTSAWKDVRGLASRSKMRDIIEGRWYRELASILVDLGRRQVDVVVVDVGDNPGGDDSGAMSTRLFTDGSVRSSPLLVTQSPTGGAYLDEQLEALRDAKSDDRGTRAKTLLGQAIATFSASKRAIATEACDLSWAWTERRNWKSGDCRRLVPAGSAGGPLASLGSVDAMDDKTAERLNWANGHREQWGAWTGPVYVLTDAKTYSSAEMFAAIMRDNGIARTVGVRTGGDGCGFMVDADPLVLPHSHLRLRMPNCVRLRADGSDEVAGIAPDLLVAPSQGESSRARGARVERVVLEDFHHTGDR